MLEALWSVEFISNVQGSGAGVAVLETGRVLGGDNQYTYVGSYKVENGVTFADIRVALHNEPDNSIFGPLKEFTLRLSGQARRDQFDLHGEVVENPALKIGIRLTRRAELP